MNRLILVVLLLVTAIGCGGVPRIHYYVLEPPDLVARASEGLLVGVAPFAVDPPYDQDRIVYRLSEDSAELGFYAYHRWAAPLSRMLPRVAASTLSSRPGIADAEPAVAGRPYDAMLHGRVLTFEEVDSPAGAAVRIRLTLRLLDPEGRELWSDTLTHQTPPTPTETVPEIVEQMRTALTTLLAQH